MYSSMLQQVLTPSGSDGKTSGLGVCIDNHFWVSGHSPKLSESAGSAFTAALSCPLDEPL